MCSHQIKRDWFFWGVGTDFLLGKSYKRLEDNLFMVLKIGSLKLEDNVVLAPMVDVTDLPYRIICREAGAAMAWTEMVYVDAALNENPKTLRMMKIDDAERPVGLQMTGSKIEHFEEFVKRKELWEKFDTIDLNCGCPSLKIAGRSRAGSFLMKNPEKIAEILSILKKTGKPVTVKVRLGFKEINVLEVAKVVEKAGADAITVHARLAGEGGSCSG
jgi:tRNA-dihydrouridine synthase B